jgi:hypothetical protein
MYVERSHWLHKTFVSKIVLHHFWLGLMVGAITWVPIDANANLVLL